MSRESWSGNMGAQGPKALMLSLDSFLIHDQYFIFWEILNKNLDFWILFENQSSATPGVPRQLSGAKYQLPPVDGAHATSVLPLYCLKPGQLQLPASPG